MGQDPFEAVLQISRGCMIVAERSPEHLIMRTLLIGFDSAWTPNNSGALIGVLRMDDGTFRERIEQDQIPRSPFADFSFDVSLPVEIFRLVTIGQDIPA